MNVDLSLEERRLILNALAKMRVDLRTTVEAADLEGFEGVEPDQAFTMAMTALDQVNSSANGLAGKLGGDPEATDFGASAISDPD